MIHIDDFVRQKLRDREEPERPGAWLAMRELLDKEMPNAVGAAFNWRQMMGYFTALLLLTVASVGGYQLYEQSHQAPQGVASNGVSTPAMHPAGRSSNADPTSEPRVSLPPATFAEAPASPRHTRSVKTTPVASHNANASAAQDAEGTTAGAPRTRVKQTGNAPKKDPAPAGIIAVASARNNAARKDRHTGIAAAETGTAEPNASSAIISASVNGATVNGHRKSLANAGPTVPSALKTIVPAANAGVIPAPVSPKPVRFIRDTIERIEIVYHRVFDPVADAYHFRLDTFPMTPVIVDRPVYEEPKELLADNKPVGLDNTTPRKRGRHTASKHTDASADPRIASGTSSSKSSNEPGTQAKPSDPSSDDAAGSANNNNNLKISKRHFSLFDVSKVSAIVEHVKTSLAKVEIYPGVMMGINASLSSANSLGGGQAGFTTLVTINDWWTVMTELKYFHRFNTGSTVRDNYLAISDTSISFPPNQQGYKQYNWKEDTVNHYFNYDVIRTLELPLALRYNWGRFYAMGGLNLTYSLAIQANEVTRAQNNPQSRMNLRPNTHDTEPFVPNSEPLVRISDFGSRFGTGYLIGGGYMFSPGVYVDLRLTQTFWDNAGTTGAKQVSSDLLHTPSFQLAVGYRFGKKK